MSSPTTAPVREFRRGLRGLIVSTIAYGAGPLIFYQTNGVFIEPVMQATGLSATEVQYGAVIMFFTGLFSPLSGLLLRRYRARTILLIGYSAICVPVVAFLLLPTTAVTVYLMAVSVGTIGSFCFVVAWSRFISTWFTSNFGAAMGIATAGGSVLPLIVTPICAYVIYTYGWQAGFIVLIAGILLFGLLPVLIGGKDGPDSPRPRRIRTAESTKVDALWPQLRTVLKDFRIPLVVIAFAFAVFGIAGFLTSIQPMLLQKGFTVEFATSLTLVIITGNALGLIVGGRLLDRLWPYIVPILVCVVAGTGGLLLATANASRNPVLVAVIVFAVGLATGSESVFPPYFTRLLVGPGVFGVVLGFAGVVMGLATVIGALTFAAIRDATGGYETACYLGAGAFAIAGLIILAIGFSRPKAQLSSGREPAPASDAATITES